MMLTFIFIERQPPRQLLVYCFVPEKYFVIMLFEISVEFWVTVNNV